MSIVEARVDDPALEALVENHLFSKCSLLIPTRGSTFFNVAAVRATVRGDVRDVLACPQTKKKKTLGGKGGNNVTVSASARSYLNNM